MDKATAKNIAEAAKKALDAVAKEFGLDVNYKGGNYDPSLGTFAPKFEFSASDSAKREFELSIRAVTVEGKKLNEFMHELDNPFTADDWNATFFSGGVTFTLCGVNLRAPKYPLLAKSAKDGKTYKFNAKAVAKALGR